MKYVFQILLLITSLFHLIGCSSATIQSSRDPNINITMHRIFFIIDHTAVDYIDKDYSPALVDGLKEEFARYNVDIRIRFINSKLSKKKEYATEIRNERESFKPDGLMVMKVVGGSDGIYGGVVSIVYNLSLYNPPSDKGIWHARIYTSGGETVVEAKMKNVAKKMAEKLIFDRLISVHQINEN